MRNSRAFSILMVILVLSIGFVISGCEKGVKSTKYSYTKPENTTNAPVEYFGVVVFNSGWIGIYDGATQTVNTPLLAGELGSSGGGDFDVVITPDGNTAIVSNFGDSTIYFIDTNDPTNPYVLGSLSLEMFTEDIALTPDGTYALVTDGGFSPTIAVVDVESRTLVETYNDEETDHQAVAVAPDGETVLTADYFAGLVNVLTIDGSGHLSFVESIDVSNGDTLHPVNVGISPEGDTAIVATVGDAEDMAFPVLRIDGPGEVVLSDMVTPILSITGAQSVAFSPSGDRAALHCVQSMPDIEPGMIELSADTSTNFVDRADAETPYNVIVVLDVTGPGEAVDSDDDVEIGFIGRSQLFGVDTLAWDNEQGYLFVSNTTVSDARNYIQILNLDNAEVVRTISFDPVTYDAGEGDEEFDAYPVGVAIWNP